VNEGTPLLAAELMHRLERLQLRSRARTSGLSHGERRSRAHGSSIQFADYREYAVGDDPRLVDWNVYGRSGHLFVKLFEDEALLGVHLLVDVSRSMDWGEPNKLDAARRLAAALGYVALARFDRLYVAPLDEEVGPTLGPLWGRDQAAKLIDGLSGWRAHRATDLGRALGGYARSTGRRPGLAIVISDFLSPSWEDGLRALLRRRHELAVVHLLCPEEVRPAAPAAGSSQAGGVGPGDELRLIDRETGRHVEIHLDAAALDAYARRFAEWTGAIERFCAHHGAAYCRVDSDAALETTCFETLRHRRVLA
jgi:uncharacterized protein (DUF58 family)